MSKRFYARPRWRNPGRAWEPRTKRQARKYATPRAFTRRAEWKYGDARTEAREQRLKQTAGRVIGVGEFFNRIMRRIFPRWRPERIDPDRYVVED